MSMIEVITEAFEGLYDLRDANKFNVAIGFFQSYNTTVESDSSGVRFCDLKLHYKDDEESKDISALAVPIMYIGSKRTIDDFELEKGDELLVMFSDRSLEQWKDSSGDVPQKLSDPVKDSINYAMAVPICTTHNANEITTTALPSGVARRVGVKSGEHLQLGNDTVDLPDILNQILDILIQPDTGGDTLTGVSAQGQTLAQLQVSLKQIAETV